MEFCISQKSGKNFTIELHTGQKIEHLQKTNRFFITTKGGALLKKADFTNKRIGLYVGKQVRILNDYDAKMPFSDYHVDLSFYEKEVMKIVNEIEPLQLTLFEMPFQDAGKKNKIEMPKNEMLTQQQKNDINTINKLGKNQLLKRIETIVENNEKVEALSPRYVYVVAFETKSMNAILYCLSKGTRVKIAIDKQAYKKFKIEVGRILYCTKFDKRVTGNVITEYKIVEKLEEIGEKLL
jgi:hypothetical protein